MTFSAPRGLNEPVCWKSSSLIATSVLAPTRVASSGPRQSCAGVRRIQGSMAARVARTSSRLKDGTATAVFMAARGWRADWLARRAVARAAGEPVTLPGIDTIADSLGAPMALPISFELCRRNVDALVTVSDDELRGAMKLLFDEMKLAVEPAGAASTAAMIGPLRDRIAGKRVGVIACGANIDITAFASHVAAAPAAESGSAA